MIYLSPESLELLIQFNNGLTLDANSYPEDQRIDQLIKHGFINSHIEDYIMSGSSPLAHFSDYSITEDGKAYLAQYEHEIHTMESIRSMAESSEKRSISAEKEIAILQEQLKFAKKQAASASKDSLISRRLSIIAILISMAAVIVQIFF